MHFIVNLLAGLGGCFIGTGGICSITCTERSTQEIAVRIAVAGVIIGIVSLALAAYFLGLDG